MSRIIPLFPQQEVVAFLGPLINAPCQGDISALDYQKTPCNNYDPGNTYPGRPEVLVCACMSHCQDYLNNIHGATPLGCVIELAHVVAATARSDGSDSHIESNDRFLKLVTALVSFGAGLDVVDSLG
eukprot:m.231945 g.231945  ORF g.231945 m.231945 type:complete len:127 (+) comp17071_c1_seq4:139-519(+)